MTTQPDLAELRASEGVRDAAMALITRSRLSLATEVVTLRRQIAAVGGGDQEVGDNGELVTALWQARYALRDYHSKQWGCGFDKLAQACELAANRLAALTRPEPAKAVEGEAIPIPFDLDLIDTIAFYARADREQGPPCPNCDKPVEVGQVVLAWDDAGEMHADCAHPFSLKVERGADEPEPVILLGEPMQQIPLAALQRPNTSGENAR